MRAPSPTHHCPRGRPGVPQLRTRSGDAPVHDVRSGGTRPRPPSRRSSAVSPLQTQGCRACVLCGTEAPGLSALLPQRGRSDDLLRDIADDEGRGSSSPTHACSASTTPTTVAPMSSSPRPKKRDRMRDRHADWLTSHPSGSTSSAVATATRRAGATLQQRAHVLDGLRGREHRQPLAQCPHSMPASARSGGSAERIVEIVHCSAHRQPTYPSPVVGLPLPGYRRDDADLVQSPIDAVDRIRPVADQRVLRVPGAYERTAAILTASALPARHC
jgi:hypothetical protein